MSSYRPPPEIVEAIKVVPQEIEVVVKPPEEKALSRASTGTSDSILSRLPSSQHGGKVGVEVFSVSEDKNVVNILIENEKATEDSMCGIGVLRRIPLLSRLC